MYYIWSLYTYIYVCMYICMGALSFNVYDCVIYIYIFDMHDALYIYYVLFCTTKQVT